MGGLSEHVFGYGSLAGELPGATPARLRDHRRVWGVAADNARALPSYKQYLLRSDGSRPDVFVAFLDLALDPGCTVNGVLAPVDGPTLAALDLRERNYDRVDVTTSIENPPGRVWSYTGSTAGRERLRAGSVEGRVVVSRDYLEAVHAAFRALGGSEHEQLLASSDLDGPPVWDLQRVDLPPEASR